MATIIKTKILLRNDELSNWEGSTLSLENGEVAFARRPDGTYEMRIGSNKKTWNELSD